MAVEDGDSLAAPTSGALHTTGELDLLRGVELVAESADLAKDCRVAEDERPRNPPRHAADRIPARSHEGHNGIRPFETDGAAPGDAAPARDRVDHVGAELPAGM